MFAVMIDYKFQGVTLEGSSLAFVQNMQVN